MIDRYTLKDMGKLWTELQKKKTWFLVELAALWAKEQLGMAPKGIHDSAQKVKITKKLLRRADEFEKVSDHDLIAFVDAVTEKLEEIVRIYFHAGLTSFDIEDTALAIILLNCIDILMRKLVHLRDIAFKKANAFRNALQIGRTHGIHAEPITFGFKLLGWVDIIDRHIDRLELVKKEIGIGKFSGAVGMYVLDPKVEELACQYLKLRPARIATQIISRDILGHYSATLVAIFNSLDKFATEIRHLAGTDISEVAEFKRSGASGSSAMPGKSMLRNPIKSENVCGLARVARGYLTPAFECEVVWGERTLENSSAERIYLPDLSISLDFALQRFSDTLEKLEVFEKQMEKNVWRTGGIVFSQRIMIKLTEKGMERKEAYKLLESLALSVERGIFQTADGKTFKDLVYGNPVIEKLLDTDEIDECFNPRLSLKHVDTIFSRFH